MHQHTPTAHPLLAPDSFSGRVLQALHDHGPMPLAGVSLAARIEAREARAAIETLRQHGLITTDDTGRLHYAAPCTPRLSLQDQIVVALEDASEPQSPEQLAAATGADISSVCNALRALRNEVSCTRMGRRTPRSGHRYRLRREAGK